MICRQARGTEYIGALQKRELGRGLGGEECMREREISAYMMVKLLFPEPCMRELPCSYVIVTQNISVNDTNLHKSNLHISKTMNIACTTYACTSVTGQQLAYWLACCSRYRLAIQGAWGEWRDHRGDWGRGQRDRWRCYIHWGSSEIYAHNFKSACLHCL